MTYEYAYYGAMVCAVALLIVCSWQRRLLDQWCDLSRRWEQAFEEESQRHIALAKRCDDATAARERLTQLEAWYRECNCNAGFRVDEAAANKGGPR